MPSISNTQRHTHKPRKQGNEEGLNAKTYNHRINTIGQKRRTPANPHTTTRQCSIKRQNLHQHPMHRRERNETRPALSKHRHRSMTTPLSRNRIHAAHPNLHRSHRMRTMPTRHHHRPSTSTRSTTSHRRNLWPTNQLTYRSLRRRPQHKEPHHHDKHVPEPLLHPTILTEAHLSSSDTSSSAVSPPPSTRRPAPPASASSPRV